MKSFIPLFLILSLLAACSKDSGSGSTGKNVRVTNPINDKNTAVTDPKVPNDYAHLRKTNVIDQKIYACLLDPKNPPVLTLAGKTTIDGKKSNPFEINLNQKFVEQIIEELLSAKKDHKLSPDYFWSTISSNRANTLNDYLVERYMNLSQDDFNLLRILVAYAMIYFMEHQDFNVGLSIQYAEKRSLKIAFSSQATEMEHIRVCNLIELKDYTIIPYQLKDTNYIVGAMNCSKDDQTVKLRLFQNKKMDINLIKQNRKFFINIPYAEIDSDDDQIEIEASGKDLEIELVLKKKIESSKRKGFLGRLFGDDYQHNYFHNDYTGIELEIEANGLSLDEKYSCTTLKKFVISQ